MKRLLIGLFVAAAVILAPSTHACPMQGNGHGKGGQHRHGKADHAGHGMGCRMDASHQTDMEVFHFLVDNRERIARTITTLDDGVETLTESDDPAIAEKIRSHVAAMKVRIDEGKPIHMRDPLFAEIFANADKIEMTIAETDKGVRVRETSSDGEVAKLIRAHAEVIEKFIENGREEMHRDHEVPTDR